MPPKKGTGKLPLFCGDRERVIPVYSKTKPRNTHHILQDKNDRNMKKMTKIRSQKHNMIHMTVQYSDSYKSLHSTESKNHTKTKTILLIIK